MMNDALMKTLLEVRLPSEAEAFVATYRDELTIGVFERLKQMSATYYAHEPQRAYEIAEVGCQIASRLHKPLCTAKALWAKGNALAYLEKLAEAQVAFEAATTIYEAQGKSLQLARMQVGLAAVLYSLGDFLQALSVIESAWQSLAPSEDPYDQLLRGRLAMNQGVVYDLMDQYRAALQSYTQARTLFVTLDKGMEIAKVDVNRALALHNLGQFDEARALLEQSRHFFVRASASLEIARADLNMGKIYFQQGHYDQAAEAFSCARNGFQSLAEHEVSWVDLREGIMLLRLNQLEEAALLLRKAWMDFTRGGQKRGAAMAALNYALIHRSLERYQEALDILEAAYEAFTVMDIPIWVAWSQLSKARLLFGQERFEEALELAGQALNVFVTNDLAFKRVYADLVSARCYLALGHTTEAEDMFQAILSWVEDQERKDQSPAWGAQFRYQCYYGLGKILVQREALTQAQEHYQQAIEHIENTRRHIWLEEFRVGFLEDKLHIYQDMVVLCLRLGDVEAAFTYVESIKSPALMDSLINSDVLWTLFDLDDPRVQRLQQLVRELMRDYSQLGKGEIEHRRYTVPRTEEREAQLYQELHKRELAYHQLSRELQMSNPHYATLLAHDRANLPDIQDMLDERTILIDYYVAQGCLAAFLVTKEGIQVERDLSALTDVEQALIELQDGFDLFETYLQNYSEDQLWARFPALCQASLGHLQRLYAQLLAPLEVALARYTRWIVVPDNILHYVPFHALHNGQDYVMTHHVVTYTPSAGVLKFCRQRPMQERNRSLLMGYTSHGELPHVLEEIKAIEPWLPNPKTFTEAQASSSQLWAYAGECDLIHLASHGALLDHNPRLSHVQLADTQLSVDQVYSLDLDASLVTLSACETGIGKLRGGDIIGLARGFFYAGTASLLVSLWTVNDASTATLMRAFYQSLRKGLSKGAALRAAQLEMLHTEREEDMSKPWYKHPYFWAPFCLMGADDKVKLADPSQTIHLEDTISVGEVTEYRGEEITISGDGNLVGNHTRSMNGQAQTITATETHAISAETVITRYTDIVCPKQVWLKTPRVSVIVRLTVRQPDFSAAVQGLQLREGLPVQVRVHASAFEVLNQPVQAVDILADADSSPLVFDLRPTRVGEARITFSFSQGTNPVGTVSVPVRVTEHQVSVTEQITTQALHVTPDAQSPDYTLYIEYEYTSSRPHLTFRLSRRGGVEREFHASQLEGDPHTYAERLYGRLTQLTARLDPTTETVIGQQRVLPPEDVDRQLRYLGQDLWRTLVPEDLKSVYAAERENWHDKTLLLVSDEPYIPWELLWPYGQGWVDDGPWCATLNFARWLRRDAQGNGHTEPPPYLRMRTLACVAPSDAHLHAAKVEQRFLVRIAAQHHVDNVSPALPTWSNVMDLLERGGYSWLHAAAHGHFYASAPDADTAIWLQNLRAFTPATLVGPQIEGHIQAQRPGFVFNACHSGREGWVLNRLGGWANRLISNGAGLFLAPLWTVTDESALTFAQTWYRALFAGEAVAAATRLARQAARRAGDPTWLAYSLYAHPNARLILDASNEKV
jgi:CHAT domain-containing protein